MCRDSRGLGRGSDDGTNVRMAMRDNVKERMAMRDDANERLYLRKKEVHGGGSNQE